MLSAELKAFYTAARLGSVTQAAKKLGLSQPTVLAQADLAKPPAELPEDSEQHLIKNDFAWASKERDRMLGEWRKRHDGKSAKQ